MQRKWKRRWQRLTKAILPPVAAGLLFLSAYSPVLANPAGGTVVSGSAAIASSASTTTVNQTTNKAVINWQSFSIGKGETVNFVQPNASSVALNRVIGNDASSIYGSLNANGKVYLINPNGILFVPGSSVNVGGLVASTLNLSDSNFLKGSYTLKKDGSTGSVVNQGTITAANEAVLIGPKVSNDGVIAAKVTGLAAGNKVSLDFSGDNLLGITVDTGAVNGSATNTGTITAAGSLVVMSAGTKDALLNTVVNNSGVIRARSVTNVGGVIRLEGNTVTNSGTLDASGKVAGQTGGTVKLLGDTVTAKTGSTIDVSGDAGGGTALIGGADQGGSEYAATYTTVQTGTSIIADAITSGNGGQVVVWANDTTKFAGTITAKGGSVSGNGGSVETSGHTLKVSGEVKAGATNGKNGSWRLDPEDLTVDATAAHTIGNSLNSNTDVTLQTSSTTASGAGTVSSGNGDITINAPIAWATGTGTLKLSAYNNINLNSAITAANGGLTLAANTSGSGDGTTSGIIMPGNSINVGTFTLASGTWREVNSNLSSFSAKDFRISGGTFLRATSGDGTGARPYAIADVYGLQGIGSAGMLSQYYTLANNIDASGTQYWNYDGSTASYAGFLPIGTDSAFNGSFDGGGHIISGLTIYRPGNYVGLFGYSSSGTISNVGMVGGSITAGGSHVGGLVGDNSGSITNSYSTGTVTGLLAGGLVGVNSGSITNSYSTGTVTGRVAGGLVGVNSGSIATSYSTGNVPSSYNIVGGLVGNNSGSITNSFWDMGTSGQAIGIGSGTMTGATGLTTSQAFTQSSYTGFGFSNTGAWYMIDDSTRPVLRSEYSTTITNAHQLQLMAMDLTASYTLANNIDMSELTSASGLWRTSTTAAADGSYGFAPIGSRSTFSGSFEGGGHTISGLTIYRYRRPLVAEYVGLFGQITGTISNVGLMGGNITGFYYTGGLAGESLGTITHCYSTGAVTGVNATGGLVGGNSGSIKDSYSADAVTTGANSTGGLVGVNTGSIKDSYSRGAVTGHYYVGGLVGDNSGSITNSYSTGTVTGLGCVGGLVGDNYYYSGSITKSFWDMDTSDQAIGIGLGTMTGATGLTTVQMKQASSYSGWDISTTGGNPSVWRIYDGYTYPLLRSFLTPLNVTITGGSMTYNGNAYTGATTSYSAMPDGTLAYTYTNTANPTGAADNAVNAGTYTISGTGLYSGQKGYDISYTTGTLTINKANITVTANATKITGQPNPAFTASYSGLGTGDTPASLTGSLIFDTAATAASRPGTYTINLTGTLSSPNYTISYVNGVLTVSERPADPTYDGAVIHAEQTAFRGARPGFLSAYWNPLSGYMAGATGTYVPLTISGRGINTGGYVPWNVLGNSGRTDN